MFLAVCLFIIVFFNPNPALAANESEAIDKIGVCSGLNILECRVNLKCGLEKTDSLDSLSPLVSPVDYSICPEDRSARLFYLMFKNFFDATLSDSGDVNSKLSEPIINNPSAIHKVEVSGDLSIFGKTDIFDYYAPGLVQSFNGVHNVYNQISFEYMFYYITNIIYLISIAFILFAVFIHALSLSSAGTQKGDFLGKSTGLGVLSKYISAFILLTPLNFINITSANYDTISSNNFLVIHLVILLFVFFGIGLANLLYGAIISVYSAPIEPVDQVESPTNSESSILEKAKQNGKVFSSALMGKRQRELYKKADEFALVFVKEALCRRNELIKDIDDTRVEERKKDIINQFVENKLNRTVKFIADEEVNFPTIISSGSKTSLRPLTYETASNKDFDYSKSALGSFHCAEYKINYKKLPSELGVLAPDIVSSVKRDLERISKLSLSQLPNELQKIAESKKANPYKAYGIGSMKPPTAKELEETFGVSQIRLEKSAAKKMADQVKACVFDNKPSLELIEVEKIHSVSLMQYALLGNGIGDLSNERSQASQDINNMALDIAENLVAEACRSDQAPGQKSQDAMHIAIEKDYSFGLKSFCTNLLTSQSGEVKDYHPVDSVFKEGNLSVEEKTYNLSSSGKMTAALEKFVQLRDALYQVLLGIDEQKVNVLKIDHVKAANELYGLKVDKNSRSICYRQKGWVSLPNYLLTSDSEETNYRLMSSITASEIEPLSVFRIGDLINPDAKGYSGSTFEMKKTLEKMRYIDNFALSNGKIYTLKEQDYFISRMSQKDLAQKDIDNHWLLPFDYNQIRGAADGRHAIFKLQDISKTSLRSVQTFLMFYLGAIVGNKGFALASTAKVFPSFDVFKYLWKLSSVVIYLMNFVLFIYVLCIFVFGYILPILPVFLFVLAFVAWFVTVFQIMLVAPLWVAFFVQYALAKGNDDQQIRHTLFVSLLQVSLRPFLLVMGFIVAWLIFDLAFIPFEYLFNDIFTTLKKEFSEFDPVQYVMLMAYLLMMFMVIFKLVEFSFETIDNLPRRMLQLLNVQGYDASASGNFVSQTAIQMAAVTSVTAPVSKMAASPGQKQNKESEKMNKAAKENEDWKKWGKD